MTKKGDRVGSICGTEDKVVEFFGFGIYEGEVIPPPGVSFMGIDYNKTGRTNPKIKLDNGDVVWGCQCWWGGEEGVKAKLEEYKKSGWEIRVVRIADELSN